MSDVIVLPPSGALLLCQCVTQGTQKEKKMKQLCASVLFKKQNKTINSKQTKCISCLLMLHLEKYNKSKTSPLNM